MIEAGLDADWSEIKEGGNFLEWAQPGDWALTNPPWMPAELYREFSRHAFGLFTNVVWLVRHDVALNTYGRHHDFLDQGHRLKEIVVIDWEQAGFHQSSGKPSRGRFPEGRFPAGGDSGEDWEEMGKLLCAIHWRRGWSGDQRWTYWDRQSLT